MYVSKKMRALKEEIALLPVVAVNKLKNAWDEVAGLLFLEKLALQNKIGEWFVEGYSADDYYSNGVFRFGEGMILDANSPEDFMCRNAKGWRVVRHLPALAQSDQGKKSFHDRYLMDVGDGKIESWFKSSIELSMRPVRRPTTVAEFTCR